jgi:hypothetical protein
MFSNPVDPPQPPLKRGEKTLKVPLFKGDLGGSAQIEHSRMSWKTRPSPARGEQELEEESRDSRH